MATKKELITSGQKLRVTNKGTGINGPVMLFVDGAPLNGVFYPSVGDELVVIGEPYKVCGSKVVPVEFDGKYRAEAFYCTVRYSTEPV